MSVKEAVLEAIGLAELRNAEDQSIDNQLGLEVGYELRSEPALRAHMTPRPARPS